MRGQRYRARDKTVRKMGRDGLSEENLRSGETARVSSRETDRLTLPGTADDFVNFQNRCGRRADDRRADGKYRGGYSPDFKRPEADRKDGVQSGIYQTRADAGETDFSSYREDTEEMEAQAGQAGVHTGETEAHTGKTEVYTETMQETGVEEGKIPESEPGVRETSSRQNLSSSSVRTSGRRRHDIPELQSARYHRQGKGMLQEVPNGSAEGSDTGQTTAQDMAGDRFNMSDSVHDRREQSSHMGNVREQPVGRHGDSGTGEGKDNDSAHIRKKKQVYAYARKTEEQKKTEEKGVHGRLQKEEGKKTGRLQFEEEGGMVHGRGLRLAGRAVLRAAGATVSAFAGDEPEEQQEGMEIEALHHAGRAGNKAFRYVLRPSSRRMQKRERLAVGEIPESGRKKDLNKFYQKQRVKKAYAKAKRGEKASKGAVEAGTFLGKAKGVAAEVFRSKKGLLMAIALVMLLFLFFAAGFSSCSAMVQGTSSTFIGTTYPSEDEDIYDAEAAYKELEEALDQQINSMETTHPGYDEYRYQVDEITHNPYQLISFLTVLYEEFTYDQIDALDMLPVYFSEQYRLTVEEVTEIRTRTETQMVTDPLTGEETEEEVEVEYEWRILCICLTNKGFDMVARSHMTGEQAALYDAYNMTYGNRSYLFDVGGLPADNPGGSDYEIPEEVLSDEQFARMIQEAEKYLGRAYVWGGASPETGFDCSGFVSWVINNCGNGWSVGRQTAEGLRRSCAAVSASEAKPGDLIFFQGTYNTSGASHVGIYAGNGMMIHCGNPIKYSNINTPYWQGHFLSYGRIG